MADRCCCILLRTYLLHSVEHVLVDIVLCVNSEGVTCGLIVVFEEEMFEGHRVLLFEAHHHLVTEAKQHQLSAKKGRCLKRE